MGSLNAPLVAPEGLEDLLLRPIVGYLATRRPDGAQQCNPMWFDLSDGLLRFSHTSDRQKARNLEADPEVGFCVPDPGNPYRYVEVRGRVTDRSPDVDGRFHRALRDRYGMTDPVMPDLDRRIIVTVTPFWVGGRSMADPTRRTADE